MVLDYQAGTDYIEIYLMKMDPDTEEFLLKLLDEEGNLLKEKRTKDEKVRLEGLTANTKYILKLCALDEASNRSEELTLEVITLKDISTKEVEFKAWVETEDDINVVKWELPQGYGVIVYRDGERISPLMVKDRQFVDWESKVHKPTSYKLEVFNKYGNKVSEKILSLR
jgi:hypothetical protein